MQQPIETQIWSMIQSPPLDSAAAAAKKPLQITWLFDVRFGSQAVVQEYQKAVARTAGMRSKAAL